MAAWVLWTASFFAVIYSAHCQYNLTKREYSDSACTTEVALSEMETDTCEDPNDGSNPATFATCEDGVVRVKVYSVADATCSHGPNFDDLITIGLCFSNTWTEGNYIKFDANADCGSPAVVGSDPVALSNGVATVFHLPTNTWIPMLQAPDIIILGETFEGKPSEQWFKRFAVTSMNGNRLVQVSIKDDIASFNRSAAPLDAFETLDVTLKNRTVPLKTMHPCHIHLSNPRIDIVFRQLRWGPRPIKQKRIGPAFRECVEVLSSFVHFAICSTSAHEYYGSQWQLAIQNAHLDIIKFSHSPVIVGILPELWGIHPLSIETKALVQEPAMGLKERATAAARSWDEMSRLATEGEQSMVEAWAGGGQEGASVSPVTV